MSFLSGAAPIRLRAEHLADPLGIATPAPRLSWLLAPDSSGQGTKQTAYQIVVGRALDADGSVSGDLWDSGRVESADSVLIPYCGTPLQSGERAWWRVRAWDEDGNASAWSQPAFWERGLLRQSDWKARWISLRMPRTAPLPDGKTLPPCAFFRREFTLSAAPIRRARLYATARGVYRVYLNGVRVGDAELAPGWTDYRRRIHYQTYDVTTLLNRGANALGAVLGDGWFSGYVGCRFRRENYGERPELLLQLQVEHEDGFVQIVTTDDTWHATQDGPLFYSDLLVGERYDARRELIGWDRPDYDATDWHPVRVEFTPAHAVPLIPQPDRPVRVVQELAPRSVVRDADGAYIVDFGQNMAGRVRVRLRGERGTTVRLRHAEVLQPDGTLYTANLRRATSTDEYILRGDPEGETYEPHFTFHGFRYVEVSGYPGTLEPEDISGRVMESETEQTGRMETGHPMVNQLLANIAWGQRGNFLSVPTDCPQRDERLGWTGDAQIFARTAACNRDVAAFLTKWMADVTDAQSPEGSFPNIAPHLVFDGDGAPAWGDAGVIVPWTLYLMYGDRGVLERCYPAMQRWIACLDAANPDGIWRERTSYNFGDWLSIDADTPREVLATAYFAYDCSLVARIAAVLGREEDAAQYHRLFERVRAAFCREFVEPETGLIEGRTQTAYVLALHMDLLPAALRPAAARHLVDDIERRGGHLSTGFVGVGYLCPVLTKAGFPEVAYRLLLNDTFPSWGYSIRHGATTLWERWDGWTHDKGFQDAGMNSFNHYSLGSVGEWLYRFVAGIDVEPEGAGFSRFILRPYPDRRLGFVRATFDSPHGQIVSAWRYAEDTFHWEIVVPPNTTATVWAPATEEADSAPVLAGLERLRWEDGRRVYAAKPGAYAFQTPARAAGR